MESEQKNESYDDLVEALKDATRDEAMARSKGWPVADDYETLKNAIRIRMVKHPAVANSIARAWLVSDQVGDPQLVTLSEADAYDYALKHRGQVVSLYGLHREG